MQYRHDDGASEPDIQLSGDSAVPSVDQSFPFSEELKELEESLALNLEEGLEVYRQHLAAQKNALEQMATPTESSDDDSGWDELARQVAGHVVSSLAATSMQAELDRSYALVEKLYDDNRAMALHVQRLVEENKKLRGSLKDNETELARFRRLLGKLYFRF